MTKYKISIKQLLKQAGFDPDVYDIQEIRYHGEFMHHNIPLDAGVMIEIQYELKDNKKQ